MAYGGNGEDPVRSCMISTVLGRHSATLLLFVHAERDRLLEVSMPEDYYRERFTISTDPTRLDLDAIHAFLAYESYWAAGIGRDTVARAVARSLCFGLYDGTAQIGFARVISDHATYAYLSDVYVVAAYRGRGLATWLLECVVTHPLLRDLRRFSLHTKDAQAFYGRFGFAPPRYPERYLELMAPDF
jgi:GNAT superfamily N-acetyltransferase